MPMDAHHHHGFRTPSTPSFLKTKGLNQERQHPNAHHVLPAQQDFPFVYTFLKDRTMHSILQLQLS